MTIKTCSCQTKMTSKNVILVKRLEGGLYYTCPTCKSTFVIISKKGLFYESKSA